MEKSSLSDAKFKSLVIRMFKELSENLKSIKKIQSAVKDTLIERKNNLQGNHSRVEETLNQINDLKYKEAKNNQSEQQEEKKNLKNRGQCKLPLGQHHRGAKRRERARNWNLFEKIMKENFLDLVKEIDTQIQEAQSPKLDGCKETHSKTHHN